MKNVDPALLEEITADLTTLCRLWAITRPDGTVKRYTDFHSNLTFDSNVYISTQAFTATATQLVANNTTSDVDISILLGGDGLDYQQLERGIYDNALIELSVVSYKNLAAGALSLLSGAVRTVTLPNHFTASLSLGPVMDKVAADICQTYTPYCRAGFGDNRCKVVLSAHTDAFTVDSVAAGNLFHSPQVAARANDYFALGTVTWLTGANTGTRIEVVSNSAGNVFTLLPCPLPVEAGDTGTITRGCPKTVAACVGYGNKANYRGEPYVPGDEGLY